ncbi:uncharacterized protein DUF1064 [Novosphingobium sp. PhB55]|nr:uncharacterized protein DUF1064 [Novosphingobium sp. PhB55]
MSEMPKRISLADFLSLPPAKAAGNKFGAQKAVCGHGHKHASKKEAARCAELHLLQRGGQICGLEVEPTFTFMVNGKPVLHPNGRKAVYKPDFSYKERGRKVCEDVKGNKATQTEASVLRMSFARAFWPDIEWIVV